MEESIFDNIICMYSQEQAIEDGVLIQVGRLKSGGKVVFTDNLFHSGDYQDSSKRFKLIDQGMRLLMKPDPEDTQYMKLRVIKKGEIWVILDGNGLTFLKPEDY